MQQAAVYLEQLCWLRIHGCYNWAKMERKANNIYMDNREIQSCINKILIFVILKSYKLSCFRAINQAPQSESVRKKFSLCASAEVTLSFLSLAQGKSTSS